MAKSPKTPQRKKAAPKKAKAEIVDAEVVGDDAKTEDATAETVASDEEKVTVEEQETPAAEDVAADAVDDAGTSDDVTESSPDDLEPSDPDELQAAGSGDADVDANANANAGAGADADVPPPAATPERRGGFFPLILGGVIAGAIGFGAAMMIFPEGWREKDDGVITALQSGLATQQDSLSDLSAQLGDLSGRVDTDLGALRDEIAQRADAVTQLGARLDELVQGDENVSLPPDVQVLLNAQKEQISKLSAEVAGMAADAKAAMEAASAQQETAEQAEARVKARGAMQVVRLALVSGEPFADALVDVEPAVDVPDGLQAVAADGAPTVAELQQDYPAAARAALSQAVREAAGDDTQSRIKLFLQDQLSARSLSPREGDDADAVLSRAEAAVKSDDLAGALAEIDALPEPAKAEFADWQARAQARLDAVNGFEAVSDALNGN